MKGIEFIKNLNTVYVLMARNGGNCRVHDVFTSYADARDTISNFIDINGRFYRKDTLEQDKLEGKYCWISENIVKEYVKTSSDWDSLKRGDEIFLIENNEVNETLYKVNRVYVNSQVSLLSVEGNKSKMIKTTDYQFIKN